jgi:hypothetical protein
MQITPQLIPTCGISRFAALKWVKKYTTIPVPEVYAYDACPDNDVRGGAIVFRN